MGQMDEIDADRTEHDRLSSGSFSIQWDSITFDDGCG